MIVIIPPVDLNNVLTDTSISIVTFSYVNDERVRIVHVSFASTAAASAIESTAIACPFARLIE